MQAFTRQQELAAASGYSCGYEQKNCSYLRWTKKALAGSAGGCHSELGAKPPRKNRSWQRWPAPALSPQRPLHSAACPPGCPFPRLHHTLLTAATTALRCSHQGPVGSCGTGDRRRGSAGHGIAALIKWLTRDTEAFKQQSEAVEELASAQEKSAAVHRFQRQKPPRQCEVPQG